MRTRVTLTPKDSRLLAKNKQLTAYDIKKVHR